MSVSLYRQNTILDLRTLLEQLLTSELGTFQNGTKAIWVEPPTSPTPGTGLHVYIERFPQQLNSYEHTWKVSLVQYDRTINGINKLDMASQKVEQRFPRNKKQVSPIREDIYPMITYLLKFNIDAY